MNCLTKQEVKNVIEGKGAASRPPILYDLWIGENVFGGDYEKRAAWLEPYPKDVDHVFLNMPDIINAPADDPNYRWCGVDKANMDEKGWDARVILEDWESDEAETLFETFPDPEYPGLIPENKPEGDRYTLARWWYLLFERHWSIRGMENALTDFYLRIMERACKEMKIDGFFVSDDLGTQNSPFFSQEIFDEFFKPYYKQIIDKAHELGTHFWLHSCGKIDKFLPAFVEIGLDVIHPIQKYTMEEKKIAEQFGDQICILAGFDVQQTIPFGTPDDVRKEVHYLLDSYWNDNGRLMFTMGNYSTEDWKTDSLKALYEETVTYGMEKAKHQTV